MKRETVSNWGNYPKLNSEIAHSSNYEELRKFVLQSPKLIARGNGRCYGDASLQKRIYSTLNLNFFLCWNESEAILECESGVLLSQILEWSIPKGFFLAVTPGTQFITIGGAIASDVHGKNHHKDGCFSEFLIGFRLMNDQGKILNCSREENSDIFWATIGGMGLTGIIISAQFQLKPIETAYIKSESIQCNNLDEMYACIEESENWTYTVAWLDCFKKNKNLGRGVMIRGEHAVLSELPKRYLKKPFKNPQKKPFRIPFYFPDFILKPWSMKIFNFMFYHKQMHKKVENIVHYHPFFYPLDSLRDWNKIYGKKGFIQYQFVLPKERGKEGMRKILETIAKSGNGSFLVVLKLFGINNPLAYNSFPQEGYTLALDFKINDELPTLVNDLDALVEEYGGRIYRAKDAMSKATLTNYLRNTEGDRFDSIQNERILKDVKN